MRRSFSADSATVGNTGRRLTFQNVRFVLSGRGTGRADGGGGDGTTFNSCCEPEEDELS